MSTRPSHTAKTKHLLSRWFEIMPEGDSNLHVLADNEFGVRSSQATSWREPARRSPL